MPGFLDAPLVGAAEAAIWIVVEHARVRQFARQHFHNFAGAIRAAVVDENDLVGIDESVHGGMDLTNNLFDDLLFVKRQYDEADALRNFLVLGHLYYRLAAVSHATTFLLHSTTQV